MPRGAPKARLALGVLVAASVALIVLDSRDGVNPVTGAARLAGETAFAPLSAGVSALSGPMSGALDTVAAAPGAADRIAELEKANQDLRAELAARDRDAGRSAQLGDLLRLSGLGGYEIVPAQAVTRVSPRGYADAVTLDVGTRDGVAEDMTVINGDGLVGRVVQAGRSTSTVLLITDGASAVGARLEGSREIGVADGGSGFLGDGAPLRFELMSADARVKEGDRVVTLGSHDGTPFVPGVPVGTVTEVEKTPGAITRTADLEPAVDIGTLDVVGVVVGGPPEDPRDSVLPPRERPGDAAEPASGGDPADAADEPAAEDDAGDGAARDTEEAEAAEPSAPADAPPPDGGGTEGDPAREEDAAAGAPGGDGPEGR
jgi:rod shape-determining protein MreC